MPYGKVWRTGANDATTITFDKAVKIQGKTLAAGTYALFTIPTEKEWTVIFNSDTKQWGACEYNQKKDVLRVTVQPTTTQKAFERLTFLIEDDENAICLHWDKLHFDLKLDK